MTIDKVTDAFAFVLEHGEFTDSILFAEEEIEELKPEEAEAVELVSKHVEQCYVGLLYECRQAFLGRAMQTPLEKHRETLERNKSRPRTVWNQGMIQVPLVIGRSWVAWISFGLWPTSEPGRPIKLSAHITTQSRLHSKLQDAVQAAGVSFNPIGNAHSIGGILPKAGQTFRELADELAAGVLPIAVELCSRLTKNDSVAS